MYILGAIVMLVNMVRTVKSGSEVTDELAEAPALQKISKGRLRGETFHVWLERKPVQLSILATIAILIGGVIQIVPTIMVDSNIPTISSVKPYTPLELEGRDIYIRESCVSCHSQMIRPFRSEVERYGEYSKAGEFVYDHPFLWGSKRTGPDLHREGGKKSNVWHFNHMYDPQAIEEKSIMPRYPWIISDKQDYSLTKTKMEAMVTLGVPYTDEEIANVATLINKQASEIANDLLTNDDIKASFAEEQAEAGSSFVPLKDREIISLIAYLQRLGTDIKVKETAQIKE